MSGASTMMKISMLETRIASSKQEAEVLRQQIEKVKMRMNDQDLIQSSKDVAKLDRNANYLKQYNKLKGHQDKIAAVRWNHDSRHLMSVSQDGYMIIWDAVTGMKVNAILLDSEWVLTGALSPSGRLAASAGLKNTCLIYNILSNSAAHYAPQRQMNYISNSTSYEMRQVSNLQPVKTILKGHRCYISDCDFVDDNTIITTSGDLTCALWDIEKGSRVREYTHHLGDVLCLSLQQGSTSSSSSPLFVTGSSDGSAKIWDSRSAVPVQQFQVSQCDVTTLKFFPDNGSFAAGSDDGVVRLFDMRADCELGQYSLPLSYKTRLAKSRRPYDMYNGGGNIGESSSLTSRNMYGDSMSIYSEIDTLGISSLDFSISGRCMYVCYSDLGCLVWDVLKDEIVEELRGHNARINQVSRSPDGMAICTASWDATINIWSA